MDEKSNTKQTILETALQLFSAKGYEGVAVSEITEATGITKPTLYYYFGSKEGVFDAVSQANYEKLAAVVAKSAYYNPNPQSYFEDIYLTLSKVTEAYFSFAQNNEAFYRMALTHLSMPRSSSVFAVVKKYHGTQYEILDNMFQKFALTHGNLHGKSKRLTWSFIGAVNSYISLYFSGFSEQNLSTAAIKELVHQFMHGIYA